MIKIYCMDNGKIFLLNSPKEMILPIGQVESSSLRRHGPILHERIGHDRIVPYLLFIYLPMSLGEGSPNCSLGSTRSVPKT